MILTDNLDTRDLGPRRDLTRDDLLAYVDTFPALMWRIEIARSRIEFLNRHFLPVLGDRSGLFMKSQEFRGQIVQPEDLHLLDAFMEAIRRGERAETIARLAPGDGETRWLKAVGWMNPRDPRYYMGYLMDVSDRAEAIRSTVEKEVELQLMIELSDIPTLLVDLETRRVISSNGPASRLFLYSSDEFRTLAFADIYHRGMTNTVHRLCDDILFSKKWEGALLFERKTNQVFSAEASMRFLVHKDRRLLRVSLARIEAAEAQDREPGRGGEAAGGAARFTAELLAGLEGRTDMGEILGTFLDRQLPRLAFDAILFSDIQARRNRVFVHAAGEPFATMQPGEMYSYEGTIAQDIERYKLDYLIVDDTLDSIKAIDWALFIPKGIRSYFAKPFYPRGVLRAVMILCSLKPAAFPSEGMPEYSLLFEPFKRSILAWRSAGRHAGGA
jgi:PAS domain-containing protein